MGYTRKQRQAMEEIRRTIMAGKRAGVCDGEGRSVTNGQGVLVAPPRQRRPTARFRDGKWVELP
jgi:hypothetical protein